MVLRCASVESYMSLALDGKAYRDADHKKTETNECGHKNPPSRARCLSCWMESEKYAYSRSDATYRASNRVYQLWKLLQRFEGDALCKALELS